MMSIWFKVCAVICLGWSSSLFAATLTDIRVTNSSGEAKVFLQFDERPMYVFSSTAQQVVLDVQQTGRAITGLPLTFNGQNLLRQIESGVAKEKGAMRLVFELTRKGSGQAVVQKQGKGYLLLFTLRADTAKKARGSQPTIAKASSQKEPSPSKNPFRQDKGMSLNSVSTPSKNNQIQNTLAKMQAVIAIDAGHGGADPGAIGPSGISEKKITLAIARKLKELLAGDPLFKPVMTREGDYFISVLGRSDVARSKGANLLISIHADAAPNRSAKGASVWVLSNKRANNELGHWLEQHEKQSELLGGAGDVLASSAKDPYLSQAVLDLQFGHSQRVGYDVAAQVLRQLRTVGAVHKRAPEHASLGVLRSPDIPSLLVETGFISNQTEEQLLANEKYQEKVANALYQGIRRYFLSHPLQAELQPSQKTKSSSASSRSEKRNNSRPSGNNVKKAVKTTHKVVRGDTLSAIAVRYGVSVAALKQANKLKSDNAMLGQTLIIPSQ